MKQSEELQIAIEAAKIGAKKALEYFNKDLKIEKKKDSSIVSIADRNTETEIKKFILSQDKNAKFLAEESGGDSSKERFWIIDPIDGTRPFVRGIPYWCVIISLYEKGEIKIGVCYFPLQKNGLFYGEKNRGAYCEKEKLHVSKVDDISDAYLMFGGIKRFTDKQPLLRVINNVICARSYEPTYGSAMVSQGRFDIAIDNYAYVWDSAPFKVMIEEAGGKITMTDGSPWNIHGRGFIATNGILHDEVIKLYNG